MKFRVTSVAGSDEGTLLNDVTVCFEDHLNAALSSAAFGSSVDQLTLVVVSVYQDPAENDKWCQPHRKIATATNPLTGKKTRYLSMAVPISPAEVHAAPTGQLPKLIALAIAKEISIRPRRLPAGLDFPALGGAVTSVLGSGLHQAVSQETPSK